MKVLLVLLMSLTTTIGWSSIFTEEQDRAELTELTKEGHRPLTSYSQARKYVMQRLHLKQDKSGYYVKDVYCRKVFRKKISPNSMPNHAEINIEHTWPQSRFNKRKSRSYQKADLHHLFPTDSRSNSTRGNVYFGEFADSEGINMTCACAKRGHFSSTGAIGFEPPVEHKGNVARALFYFSMRYEIRLPDHEEFFLRQWHILDPVDQEEINRNDIVEEIQGNRNPFVDDPTLVDYISNF